MLDTSNVVIETSNRMLDRSNRRGSTYVRTGTMVRLEQCRYDDALEPTHETDRAIRTMLDDLLISEDAEETAMKEMMDTMRPNKRR